MKLQTAKPKTNNDDRTDKPVVLRAVGLRKSFGGQVVLDGVDLELRQGEVVLLQGENGSGKTTLLNILTGNLKPDSGTITYLMNDKEKEFAFPQSWFSTFNPSNRFAPDTVARLGLGRSWQDVRLFKSLSLEDNIAVANSSAQSENPLIALLSWSKSSSSDSIGKGLLGQLGLSGREQSSGDMVSLGQSKRVAIARAIAAGATILLLDEPLAGLDQDGVNEVLEMLADVKTKHDITLVIIEHYFNQTHLRELITSQWNLNNGKLTVSNGRVAHPNSTKSNEQPVWLQMFTEAADEITHEPLPRGARLTRFRIASRYKPSPILQIEDLVVKRGDRTVVGLDDEGNETGFNLTINEGEIAILQAPNGWGKSTLLETISRILHENEGVINFCDSLLVANTPSQALLSGIVYLPAATLGFPSLTVSEVLKLVNLNHQNHPFPNQKTSTLSGGQHQFLTLSLIDLTKPQLLLDEPFNGLDNDAVVRLCDNLLESASAISLVLPKIFECQNGDPNVY